MRGERLLSLVTIYSRAFRRPLVYLFSVKPTTANDKHQRNILVYTFHRCFVCVETEDRRKHVAGSPQAVDRRDNCNKCALLGYYNTRTHPPVDPYRRTKREQYYALVKKFKKRLYRY